MEKPDELTSQGHCYPGSKTKDTFSKRKKLYANNPNEHRCKNPQQNVSKPNSATHYKGHRLTSSGVFLVQYPQIN